MSAASNHVFCTVVVLVSLAAVMGIYVAFSRRCGNFINALTPFVLVPVPAYFILELVNIYVFGYTGSHYAYIYIYVTYVLGVLAKAVAYLATPSSRYSLLIRVPVLRIPGAAFVCLALGGLLYSPVLIQNVDLLMSPREIYASTRTGYGIETFVSALCVYIGLILLLSERSRGRTSRTVYLIIAVPLLYLHGSKGQVFALFLIWLYFLAFVEQRRFDFRRLVFVSLGVTTLMMALFYLTFPGALRQDLIESVAGYSSEYTRNAVLVIDDTTLQPQLGRLTLEDNFYSVIPRQIFPEKPKDFGALWLASRYFPARFQAERGAPAFGLGIAYADFGVFAVIYYIAVQALLGAAIKVLAAGLKIRPDAGSFLFLLVLLDVPLIPTGTGSPLPLYYVIALLTKCIGGRAENDAPWGSRTIAA